MKIKKGVLFIGPSLLLIYFITVMFLGYPVVLDFSNNQDGERNSILQKGDTIEVFENFDFDHGEWAAYLFINGSDENDLSKEIPGGRRLKTTDKDLLQQMQREWKFIYTGGDVATVESSIILCNNGKKVFESGIALDTYLQGLQGRQFGWLNGSNVLVKYCSRFQKIYSPIIILR